MLDPTRVTALSDSLQSIISRTPRIYASDDAMRRYGDLLQAAPGLSGRDIVVLDPSNPDFPPEYEVPEGVAQEFRNRTVGGSASGTSLMLPRRSPSGETETVPVGVITISSDGLNTLTDTLARSSNPQSLARDVEYWVLLHEIGHTTEDPEPIVPSGNTAVLQETWTLEKETGADAFAANHWPDLVRRGIVTNPDIPRIMDAVRDVMAVEDEIDLSETLGMPPFAKRGPSEHPSTEHATGIYVRPEGGPPPTISREEREQAHRAVVEVQRQLFYDVAAHVIADPSSLDPVIAGANGDDKDFLQSLKDRLADNPPTDQQDMINLGEHLASSAPDLLKQAGAHAAQEQRFDPGSLAERYLQNYLQGRDYLAELGRKNPPVPSTPSNGPFGEPTREETPLNFEKKMPRPSEMAYTP